MARIVVVVDSLMKKKLEKFKEEKGYFTISEAVRDILRDVLADLEIEAEAELSANTNPKPSKLEDFLKRGE